MPKRRILQNKAYEAALDRLERNRKRGGKGLSLTDLAAIGSAYVADSVYKRVRPAPAGAPSPAPRPQKAFVRPTYQSAVAGSSRTMVNFMVRSKHGQRKPIPLIKSMASPSQTIIRSGTFNFQSTTGEQANYLVPLMDMCLNVDDTLNTGEVDKELAQVFSVASRAPMSRADMDISNLDPGVAFTEEYIKKQRVYLKSQRVHFKMVNTTNAPIKVTIRTFRCKRDTNYLVPDFWDRVSRAQDNYDNLAGTVVGFSPYNHVLKPTSPDASPSSLYLFKDLFYEASPKKVVEMDAGAEHKHYHHSEYSQPIRGTSLFAPGYLAEGDPANSDPTTQNKQFLAKYTTFVMFTVLGPKVQTAVTNIQSYAPGQLSVWYNSTTLFYNYPVPLSSTKYYYNDISTVPIPQKTVAGVTTDDPYMAVDNEDAGDAPFTVQMT